MGTTSASRLRGHTYLLPDGDRVGAACMWGPPEIELMNAEERAAGPSTIANRYGDEGRERMRSFGKLMHEHHPTEPHFYLWIVGVDPDLQGRGLGAQLLTPTLAHCDATEMPAYLESSNPRNVPFYGRLGFEVQNRVPSGRRPADHGDVARAAGSASVELQRRMIADRQLMGDEARRLRPPVQRHGRRLVRDPRPAGVAECECHGMARARRGRDDRSSPAA